MNICYLKELTQYSRSQLLKETKFSESDLKHYLDFAKKKRICKEINGSFSFQYVGLILYRRKIVFFLPKYTENNLNHVESAKKIIELLGVYSNREFLDSDDIETLGDTSFQETNFISLVSFLVQHFLEYGLYYNQDSAFELNGSGQINWSKTVDEQWAFPLKQSVIYLDYFNDSIYTDDNFIITKLHKIALIRSIEFLKGTGLSALIQHPDISYEIDEDEFGSIDYIISQIRREMISQYLDHKQILLKALEAFYLNGNPIDHTFDFILYGTKNFHIVWEKVCAFTLGDNLQQASLMSLIDKPEWVGPDGLQSYRKTFIPDILLETEYNFKKSFIILDAKYYNIQFNNKGVLGNPGIEDVSKQYFYEMAFLHYFEEQKIEEVYNVLLFPHENNDVLHLGKVKLGFMKNIGLRDISLVKLPDLKLYSCYIENKRYTISKILDLL